MKRRAPEDRKWRRWVYELMYYYGMTEAEYNELATAQGGVCAICKANPEGRLAVDHDHETKQVRGLLCRPCNSGLGLLGDTRERLARALEYLS